MILPLTEPVLTIGTLTPTSVAMSWTATTQGVSPYTYSVARSIHADMSSPTVLVSGQSGTTYTRNTTASPSTQYYYQITATDANSNTVTSNIGSALTPSTLNAGTISETSHSSTSLGFSVTAPTGGVSPYTLQKWSISLHGAGMYVLFGSGATSLATGLTASTAYDIKVHVSDTIGDTADSYLLNVSTDAPASSGNTDTLGDTFPYVNRGIIGD